MTNRTGRWRRALCVCRAFGRDAKGLAAVEFALIAAPFFFMMFAVLEVALVFFASTLLENATTEAARDIRTGNFQAGNGGEAQFKQAICDRATVLIDCNNLTVDVRTYANFGLMNASQPIDDDGELDDSGFGFQPGGEREIVLVRVFYEWPVVTPLLGAGFSNMSGNRRLLTAAAAFRNEPFGG